MDDIVTSVAEIRLKNVAPSMFLREGGTSIEFVAASLVSKDENLPFVRVLPIESNPAIADVEALSKHILANVRGIEMRFVRIAYYVAELKRSKCYRYVKDVGDQGYQSFYKFCEDTYGLKQKMVQRLVLINERFCANGPAFVSADYERFKFRQLAEMARFENGLEQKISPTCSVRNIEKLRKYYAKKDWISSSDTTWEDDLAKQLKDEEEESRQKRVRLKKFKFEAADETRQRQAGQSSDSQSKAKNAYKSYDAFLLAVDQSTALFEELKKKCPSFAAEVADILALLSKKGQEARYAKSREIFDDFS